MRKSEFVPGFRLSVLDVVVLLVGGVCAAGFGMMVWWVGLVIGLVVGHFFLFCNVFRVARALELAWAAVFLALAVGTIALDVPGWAWTVAGALAAAAVVVGLEMRKPSYHGIGWRRINPDLPAWWQSQDGETPVAVPGAGPDS